MKKKLALFISVILITGCATNVKKSSLNKNYEVEVVEASGTAPVINGDLSGAKEASLSDALKNALHLVVGVYLTGQTLVSKSVLIDDEINSQTQGYIEKYEVLKEGVEENFYKTKIKAYVRKEELTGKIKMLENDIEKIGSPAIYTVVVDSENNRVGFAEDSFASNFRKDNFRVISDTESFDLIVNAKVETNFNTSQGLGGFKSYVCSINGNVKTSDGEVVYGFNSNVGGMGLTDIDAKNTSISRCVEKVYPEIKESIIRFYTQKRTIKLKVLNLSSINELNSLIKELRNIPSIKTAVVKNYDNDTADIDLLVYKSKTDEIASLISKKSLDIISIKGQSIIAKKK